MKNYIWTDNIRPQIALPLIIICLLFLTACTSKSKQELYILNAVDSINVETLTEFEKKTNTKIYYNTYENPEDIIDILNTDPNKYDVIIAPNYITSRLIKENRLSSLQKNELTNYKKIIEGYTPNTEYTFPYMAGTLGILYDENKILGKIDSWNVLWDSSYKNNIIMTTTEREAISIALKTLGFDVNDKDKTHIELAQSKLQRQFGVVQSYQGTNTPENMAWGRATLAVVTSNEAQMAIEKSYQTGYAKLNYVIPKEGSVRFVTSMCIPTTSRNEKTAVEFINFMSDAEVSAKNSTSTGLTGTMVDTLVFVPENIRTSTVMYPTEAELKLCKYNDYDISADLEYGKAWRLVKNSIWKR